MNQMHFQTDSKTSSASSSTAAASPSLVTSANASAFLDPTNNKFTLAQLQAKNVTGVDPAHRELYLSDKEFQVVFKMDAAAFVRFMLLSCLGIRC